ncbi:MAG: hypothetical protein PUE64_01210 [Firmicutes bacterium]|nr:hypothetical protein [Bacillota bacterium]
MEDRERREKGRYAAEEERQGRRRMREERREGIRKSDVFVGQFC